MFLESDSLTHSLTCLNQSQPKTTHVKFVSKQKNFVQFQFSSIFISLYHFSLKLVFLTIVSTCAQLDFKIQHKSKWRKKEFFLQNFSFCWIVCFCSQYQMWPDSRWWFHPFLFDCLFIFFPSYWPLVSGCVVCTRDWVEIGIKKREREREREAIQWSISLFNLSLAHTFSRSLMCFWLNWPLSTHSIQLLVVRNAFLNM